MPVLLDKEAWNRLILRLRDDKNMTAPLNNT